MTDGLLDLASVATQIAYLAFFVAAVWAEYRTKTLASLRKACQRYWTAVALGALGLVIHLASVSYDGWGQVASSALTTAICLGCAVLTDRKRDRLIVAEMQRDLDGAA